MVAALAVAGAGFSPEPAASCGYHSAATVALGALNWAFPNALYVRTAVWQAQNSSLLPPRRRLAARDMFAYHRTVADLERMRGVLQAQAQPASELTVAILLLKPMLWSRYRIAAGTAALAVHTEGAEGADVVVVTDEPVAASLAAGGLSIQDAEEHGLVRYYGDAGRIVELRRLMQGFRGPVQGGHDTVAAGQVKSPSGQGRDTGAE